MRTRLAGLASIALLAVVASACLSAGASERAPVAEPPAVSAPVAGRLVVEYVELSATKFATVVHFKAVGGDPVTSWRVKTTCVQVSACLPTDNPGLPAATTVDSAIRDKPAVNATFNGDILVIGANAGGPDTATAPWSYTNIIRPPVVVIDSSDSRS